MRLDKYLADSHAGSRSEVREQIRRGRVLVNGVICRDPGFRVEPEAFVTLNGVPVDHREHYYYMLNKPAGVVCATEDRNEATVLELFPANLRKRLFPAGRLDKDSTGLLLVCDDGELAHRLLSPSSHVDKKYLIRTDGPLTKEHADRFKEGIILGDGTVLQSAVLEISGEDPCSALVTIHEGKYHQIKRMTASLGRKVVFLKRLSMGPLKLDPALKEGEYRELTAEEIEALRKA
ncbi:MAG: rRNA pseudouridine synthase [Lachnospiraceae bacterium]|nr:rRNA pseudouridine synthase [Lachnospiraceae bacterium]